MKRTKLTNQSRCWERRNPSAVFYMDEESIIRNIPLDNRLNSCASPEEPLYL